MIPALAIHRVGGISFPDPDASCVYWITRIVHIYYGVVCVLTVLWNKRDYSYFLGVKTEKLRTCPVSTGSEGQHHDLNPVSWLTSAHWVASQERHASQGTWTLEQVDGPQTQGFLGLHTDATAVTLAPSRLRPGVLQPLVWGCPWCTVGTLPWPQVTATAEQDHVCTASWAGTRAPPAGQHGPLPSQPACIRACRGWEGWPIADPAGRNEVWTSATRK